MVAPMYLAVELTAHPDYVHQSSVCQDVPPPTAADLTDVLGASRTHAGVAVPLLVVDED